MRLYKALKGFMKTFLIGEGLEEGERSMREMSEEVLKGLSDGPEAL